MQRGNLNDLFAFLTVARERSFTRAAAQLGVSQSALSHTIRALEERLALRLLTRTTRSVSPTEAGERLLHSIGPHFEKIDAEIAALNEFKEKPVGNLRISATEHVAAYVIFQQLNQFLHQYPDIRVEVTIDYSMIDIVEQKYDAGVRTGEQIAKDMIAVRIGPDTRMAVVATAAYFEKNPPPKVPQDLAHHSCINLRLPTYDNIYVWEFEKGSEKLKVPVKGQLTLNMTSLILKSALAGSGVAYVPEDMALPYIVSGDLVRVLKDWCPPFPGYYLYYPNRRQSSLAFNLLIDALRYQPETQ